MDFFNQENEFSMAAEKVKNDYALSLTKREIEIMRLVAKGCSNKQIAAKLFISEETVKKHLKNIFCKLNASNRIDAMHKLGLIK